jgi:hypothetical protein
MLSWYLRDTKGTRGVLKGSRGVLKRQSTDTQGVLMLLSIGPLGVLAGSWGVLWGTQGVLPESSNVRVTLCIFWVV